jgi:hypothetical protein
MQIIKKDFPTILKENELSYFSLLEGIINSVDQNSCMEVRHTPHSYIFRVSPSMPFHINSLVEEVNKLHTLLNIHVEYGKSLKNAGIMSFSIELTE